MPSIGWVTVAGKLWPRMMTPGGRLGAASWCIPPDRDLCLPNAFGVPGTVQVGLRLKTRKSASVMPFPATGRAEIGVCSYRHEGCPTFAAPIAMP